MNEIRVSKAINGYVVNADGVYYVFDKAVKVRQFLIDNILDEFDMSDIGTWRLSFRTLRCLYKSEIKTWDDLKNKSENDLLRTPDFGRKSLNELKEYLAEKNLYLISDKNEF